MALRTIGSTLQAKANPGGALRSKDESLINRPDIPDSGAVGSVNRQLVEEPLQRQVPEGSAKVVSSTPAVEGTTVAAPGVNTGATPMAPVGLMGEAPSGTPSRGASQPLFAGGVAPEAGASAQPRSMVKPGVAASAASGGPVANAGIATGYLPPEQSQPTQVQGQASQDNPTVLGALSNLLGLKTFAGNGNPVISTLGQQIAGTAGKAISAVGNALKAPQIVPGGVGAAMQSYGGAPSVTQSGGGSVSKAVQQAAAALRSYNPVQTFQSNVSKAASVLRSLFGRK